MFLCCKYYLFYLRRVSVCIFKTIISRNSIHALVELQNEITATVNYIHMSKISSATMLIVYICIPVDLHIPFQSCLPLWKSHMLPAHAGIINVNMCMIRTVFRAQGASSGLRWISQLRWAEIAFYWQVCVVFVIPLIIIQKLIITQYHSVVILM